MVVGGLGGRDKLARGDPKTGASPLVVRILFTALYFHVCGDKICRGFHKNLMGWVKREGKEARNGVEGEKGGASRRDGGVMGNVMRQG